MQGGGGHEQVSRGGGVVANVCLEQTDFFFLKSSTFRIGALYSKYRGAVHSTTKELAFLSISVSNQQYTDRDGQKNLW